MYGSYICVNICRLINVRIFQLYTHIHSCIYKCVHNYPYMFIHSYRYMYIYMNVYIHIYVKMYVHRCTCIFIFIYKCTYAWTCVCVFVCIIVHVCSLSIPSSPPYTHMHTHTHTHTRSQMQVLLRAFLSEFSAEEVCLCWCVCDRGHAIVNERKWGGGWGGEQESEIEDNTCARESERERD